jgi:hypothetical protein
MRPIWAATTTILQHLMISMRVQPQAWFHIFTSFADVLLLSQEPVSQVTDTLQSSIAASASCVYAWLCTHKL